MKIDANNRSFFMLSKTSIQRGRQIVKLGCQPFTYASKCSRSQQSSKIRNNRYQFPIFLKILRQDLSIEAKSPQTIEWVLEDRQVGHGIAHQTVSEDPPKRWDLSVRRRQLSDFTEGMNFFEEIDKNMEGSNSAYCQKT